MLIRFHLNPGEQVGDSLYLVDNRTIRIIGEEAAWVVLSEGPNIRAFQIDIGLFRKCLTTERCFSRLARPGDCDDRLLFGALSEGYFDILVIICNAILKSKHSIA